MHACDANYSIRHTKQLLSLSSKERERTLILTKSCIYSSTSSSNQGIHAIAWLANQSTAMQSISILTFFGKADTSTQDLEGGTGHSLKYS